MTIDSTVAQIALVTGAAGDIGQEICLSLQREGYYVFGADQVEVFGKHGTWATTSRWHRALEIDVTDPISWSNAVGQVEQATGKLHLLVNNAGVLIVGDVEETSLDAWERTLSVNLTGAFLGIRACASLLRNTRGCVVNVSSVVGLRGNDRMVAYAASKAGLLGLTYATAKDFSSHGVRVNAVCPGTVDTQMTKPFFTAGSDEQAARRSSVAKHPLGRLGSAAEVASAVTYLASAGANFITGVALPVDGGRSIG